jgi:hypothetical protein
MMAIWLAETYSRLYLWGMFCVLRITSWFLSCVFHYRTMSKTAHCWTLHMSIFLSQPVDGLVHRSRDMRLFVILKKCKPFLTNIFYFTKILLYAIKRILFSISKHYFFIFVHPYFPFRVLNRLPYLWRKLVTGMLISS